MKQMKQKYTSNKVWKKLFSLSLLWMSVLVLMAPMAQASLMNIVIDGGQTGGIPIAVIPFQLENANQNEVMDLSDLIHKDLQSSGQFSPLATQQIRQFPHQRAEVQFPYWQSLHMEDLVLGRVRKTGATYTVNFELLDIVRQKMGGESLPLLAMQFDNIKPQDFRALAHHISDLIFEKIIGVKGFFSTRIAYISTNQSGKGVVCNLEIADYDGHNPRTLYRSNFPIMSPTWSPDGKKIAFVSFEKERSSINVIDLSGRVERLCQFPGINSAPAWSPDGRTLALVLSKDGGPKIYTMDLASKNLSRLTEGNGIDTEPSFAPDGRSIVFTSDRGGKPQIYRVTLGSRKVDRITFAGNYNAKPSLTPDGKNLVTLHRGDEGLFCIAVHSLTHGGHKILTQTGLNDSPTLAPNGMMVIYGALSGGKKVLGAVTLDGRLKIRLPGRDGEVQEPAWSPFVAT